MCPMLLKDALAPTWVQTLEHTPALLHGGPFGNIAHGCNSVWPRAALKAGRLGHHQAGFGADLGAEGSSTSSAAPPACDQVPPCWSPPCALKMQGRVCAAPAREDSFSAG